jgi:hypothetical protein
MAEEYRPRLAIDISEEQKKLLDKHIPWGSKTHVFGVIIQDLVQLCQTHGAGLVIGAFLERKITLEQMCKLKLPERSNNGNDR